MKSTFGDSSLPTISAALRFSIFSSVVMPCANFLSSSRFFFARSLSGFFASGSTFSSEQAWSGSSGSSAGSLSMLG